MRQTIHTTDEETAKMYAALPKKRLIELLIQANKELALQENQTVYPYIPLPNPYAPEVFYSYEAVQVGNPQHLNN